MNEEKINSKKKEISVRDIYAHTQVEYILLYKFDDKNSEDYKKFEELLTKISKI